MSEWIDIPSDNIDIDNSDDTVGILVTFNDFGNVYAVLTFDQINDIHAKINKKTPIKGP